MSARSLVPSAEAMAAPQVFPAKRKKAEESDSDIDDEASTPLQVKNKPKRENSSGPAAFIDGLPQAPALAPQAIASTVGPMAIDPVNEESLPQAPAFSFDPTSAVDDNHNQPGILQGAGAAPTSAASAAPSHYNTDGTDLLAGLTAEDFRDDYEPSTGVAPSASSAAAHSHYNVKGAGSAASSSAAPSAGLRIPKRQALSYKSSKGRHLRAIQRKYKGTKNTAQIKLTHPDGHVIRLYARSMGHGNHLNIDGEERSHSEALLLAAQRLGHIKDGDNEIDLSKYQKSYISSSNLACQKRKGSENCTEQVVPQLTQDDNFYGFNDLSKTYSAEAFGDKVAERDANPDDESEPESDTEEVRVRRTRHYMIDGEFLQGKNINEMATAGQKMPVHAISFSHKNIRGKRLLVQN